MTEYLELKWSVSRGRETYGYNIATLRTQDGKRYTCNGGGYDMIGTVFGAWLQDVHQAGLTRLDVSQYYGATKRDDGSVHLDGACGLESIRDIAKALGLTVKATTDRKGNYTGFMVEEVSALG